MKRGAQWGSGGWSQWAGGGKDEWKPDPGWLSRNPNAAEPRPGSEPQGLAIQGVSALFEDDGTSTPPADLPAAFKAMMARVQRPIQKHSSAHGSGSSVDSANGKGKGKRSAPPELQEDEAPSKDGITDVAAGILQQVAMMEETPQGLAVGEPPPMMSPEEWLKKMQNAKPAEAKAWLEKEVATFVEEHPEKLNASPEGDASSEANRLPCKFFAMGTCSQGDACAFVHDYSILVPLPLSQKVGVVCSFFSKEGSCSRGVACPFAHGGMELNMIIQAKRGKGTSHK